MAGRLPFALNHDHKSKSRIIITFLSGTRLSLGHYGFDESNILSCVCGGSAIEHDLDSSKKATGFDYSQFLGSHSVVDSACLPILQFSPGL